MVILSAVRVIHVIDEFNVPDHFPCFTVSVPLCTINTRYVTDPRRIKETWRI